MAVFSTTMAVYMNITSIPATDILHVKELNHVGKLHDRSLHGVSPCPPRAGGSRGVASPPHGHEVCLPQRRPQGGGLRMPATWLRRRWRRGEGVPPTQGTLWLAPGTARLERETRCHTQEDGLQAERA